MKVEKAPPAALDVQRVVRPPRCRPEPAVPIHDTLGRLRFRREPVVGGCGRVAVSRRCIGLQLRQLAELAAARQIDAVLEVCTVAALGASLVDPAEAMVRVGQRPTLGDRHRAGLFAIHVFARLGGKDRQQRMPAVPGCDQHGVYVSALPKLVHVAVHRAVIVAVMLVDLRLNGFAALVARVADRPELHIVLGEERLEVALASSADTQSGHIDPVTRRDCARQAQDCAGNE